ncbi:MAG: molybdopterin biosynthesis protein [Nitrospinota bacterium]
MKTKRRVYLERKPAEEILPAFLGAIRVPDPLPTEVVSIPESLGRITGEPLLAKISSPHYHASAMDGVAVNAVETIGASESRPLELHLGPKAAYVDTGDPLPEGTNSVVVIEDVQPLNGDRIEILSTVRPWQNVRTMGEDLVASQLILPSGRRIRPYDIGALLAGGYTEIPVRRKPRVVILPTGTELVQPGTPLKPGDIIEFNSRMLGAFVREWGAEWVPHPIVPDDAEALLEAVRKALRENDVVVVNAGSSAGEEDYTVHVFETVGEVIQHGVALAPGQPAIFAHADGKALLGCPGFPVSGVVIFNEFVRPLMGKLLGIPPPCGPRIQAVVGRKLPSKLGLLEHVRVKVGEVNGRTIALPLSRASSLTTSMAEADGVIRIPRNAEGLEKGVGTEVELFHEEAGIDRNILLAGSHDLALDLLTVALAESTPGTSLSKAPMGSLDGLLALKGGEAHLAGCHLLDPETGEYNFPLVSRHFSPGEAALVNFVYRQQGLVVPRGNPRGIGGIADLTQEGIRFVNRQRGAGTRVLLDHQLELLGIDPDSVAGYDRVVSTHMALAAAVASGAADVGLGVMSAASALDLDFLPVGWERFDLVVPAGLLDSALLAPLFAVLGNQAFREKVLALGGYQVHLMGEKLHSDPGPPPEAE